MCHRLHIDDNQLQDQCGGPLAAGAPGAGFGKPPLGGGVVLGSGTPTAFINHLMCCHRLEQCTLLGNDILLILDPKSLWRSPRGGKLAALDVHSLW